MPYSRWFARGAKNEIVRINSTVFERRPFGSANPSLATNKNLKQTKEFVLGFFFFLVFCKVVQRQ